LIDVFLGYSKSNLLDMAELIAEIDENSKTNEQLSDARTATISNLINKENSYKRSSSMTALLLVF